MMPLLTRIMIRISLSWFLAGSLLGAWMLIDKGLSMNSILPQWRGIHITWMIDGWLFNLIFAVAYWILPRKTEGPERGTPLVTVLAFSLLNLSVILSQWYPTHSAILRMIGVAAFLVQLWPRIYSFRQLLAKGGGTLFPDNPTK